jgi:hypothetical protein
MNARLHVRALGAAIVLASTATGAQGPGRDREGDLLLRVNAPVTVAPAESASTLWVIGDDAIVEGTVRQHLVVMGGTARISGTVDGNVAVFNGTLELAPTAHVGRDVTLYRSTLSRASGAQVGGKIETSRGPAFGEIFALGFWVSMTVVVVAFGLLFAAVGSTPLRMAVRLLASRPGAVVGTSAVTWGSLPLLAVVSLATVVGIPLGIAILVFLLPALGFAGLIVTGTAIGTIFLGEPAADRAAGHPYAAAAIGLITLQAVGFVPVIGALLVLLAGAIGAGALVHLAWTEWRGPGAAALVPAPAQ